MARCLMCGKLIGAGRMVCKADRCRERLHRMKVWYLSLPDVSQFDSIEEVVVAWLTRPGARLRRGVLRTRLKVLKRAVRRAKHPVEFTFTKPPPWSGRST